MVARAFIEWKLKPYPVELGKYPIFIFNHIPKCGGTSLNIVLRNWFHLVRDYPPHDLQYPDPKDWDIAQSNFEKDPPKLNQLKPYQILAGHYHHPRNRFSIRLNINPTNKNFKKITFLREPLAHRLSLYKFGVKRGHNWVNGFTLNEYIKSESNFFAKVLECDDDNYQQVLDSYFFVGILEENEKSIQKLSKAIGRKVSFKIPHVNQTDSKTEFGKLNQLEIDQFKKVNELDYKIYQYALEAFNNS